jgi:TolB-like protein
MKALAILRCLGLALLAILATGCSQMQVRSFIDSRTDFLVYEDTAVFPFDSQADDALAGDKLTEHFVTEVLREGKLHVMDPGQFRAFVGQATNSSAPVSAQRLSPSEIRTIGELAGVQGIFMGVVHDYKMVQIGSEQYPLVSMTAKFIDVATGTLVWQANLTARGGPNLPLISVGESYVLGELSQKIVQRAVHEFYKKSGL